MAYMALAFLCHLGSSIAPEACYYDNTSQRWAPAAHEARHADGVKRCLHAALVLVLAAASSTSCHFHTFMQCTNKYSCCASANVVIYTTPSYISHIYIRCRLI